ncbi:ABC transporter ATP-binding protein [Craterilacuibacter sp. RT1T]|uniref:ABC transporter ATP-binding protein n=1 Tax=Craterilacuibacter sp. RT1T TaxID=2942211 RepID=UPI0020BEF25D|nr:ABC transporter ATP-binding protein [Craterilacuibacter sp. RT1T]MCL6264678.1 ABC transporter ATP-binding protein [Craterilacuibacter sp. RT1T]
MSALLEFSAVSHAYGTRRVIDSMSFSLQDGEIGCLLGGSGCGKTTVLRCIAGFETLGEGEIRLSGRVLADAAMAVPAHQREIGMVFQDYALFPHLTVEDNIGFGLSALARGERKSRVGAMLALVGLTAYAKNYPHELSGGQQQRVALARALATRPRLLLLDEPFSNLDVDLRERLSREVRDILKHEGVSAILVTHDQHEAFAVADKVGVMQGGALLQWATPYQLYHEPVSRYVANFIGQGVLVPGKVSGPRCLALEVGEFCGLLPLGFACGDTVDVLLRPDDVVHDDASEQTAVVIDKVFRGADFHYTLALPSGQHVLAQVGSHHNHAIGEAIGIRLELDHLIAFKRE